jgi:hypothetical protein
MILGKLGEADRIADMLPLMLDELIFVTRRGDRLMAPRAD